MTRMDVVRHEHNPDRTRENGWAYWRCSGCGELCHYAAGMATPAGIAYCTCCTAAGALPCLACGDPCLPAEHNAHILVRHPVCPECNVLANTALGSGHADDCRFCAGDQTASEELARGEGRRFATAADAAAWLQDGE